MIQVNGWTILAHPQLLGQIEALAGEVAKAKKKDPEGWSRTANAKVLAGIETFMFKTVPDDPTRSEYRQGNTLGPARKHWFRVKFANGRFRLFFRYDSSRKIIVFAWVNDQDTLRTYGSKTDAYAVFGKKLDSGDPPDDWAALLAAASTEDAKKRLASARPGDS